MFWSFFLPLLAIEKLLKFPPFPQAQQISSQKSTDLSTQAPGLEALF